MRKTTSNLGTHFDEGPFRVPFPEEMLKVVQDQYSNNEDARVARFREVHCPFFGDLNSRNDQIALSVEDARYADDDLADVLGLDTTNAMEVWEGRPISLFECLAQSCRAPIPVRNRTQLLRLLRVEKFFALRFGAGDLVEFKTLCEMLCQTCAQGEQHRHDEQRQADLCIRQARIAELRKMSLQEYQRTSEWRARRNRVLLRAAGASYATRAG